ncbi:HAMP domain-containing sensor histidine kinase [Ideonella sp. B508-1]|uniref:sensor histidine kinase n=1 Tax=Ideonella sp. B508-1 TaxID=137716 RepID=UPI00034C1B65|nr:HAMP domain-containing histidine kinase [Ideonella sp. B508-1]
MPLLSGSRLFTRFFLALLLMALGLATVLGVVFYMERSRAMAELVVDRWAPALRAAAGIWTLDDPPPLRDTVVLQSEQRPPGAGAVPVYAARLGSLRDVLAERGLPPRNLAVDTHQRPAVLWIELAPGPAGHPRWYGIREPSVEPSPPQRILAVTGGVVLMAAALAWWLARWLTRPLDALRQRMARFRPGQTLGEAEAPLPGASEEVLAIDEAWQTLAKRLTRFEQERALMLAGVSHDLRSPLGRIQLAASLLPDTPEVAQRRASIERNVQVADQLIQGFLDHARIGALALDQAVDVVQVARQVVLQRHDAAEAAGFALRAELPPALVLPHSHPQLLERLLANLVDNALQYGGSPVVVRAGTQGPRFWLEVQDGGPGIPADQHEQVLQAFYRGDPGRARPGSGLGLAIVREAALRLGATLTLRNGSPGFTVRLEGPLDP